MLKPLNGQVALVTGAAGGIGQATALELSRLGARVLVNYRRNAAAAEQLCADIAAAGGEALAFAADVTDEQAVASMVDFTLEHWQRLDVLVANAGIIADAPLARLKPEQWHQVIETNLTAIFFCCRAVAPVMRRQAYGRIVSVGSLAGLAGNVGQVNYAAAKAGLVGFSRSLARELAPQNITVNVVAPGYIETEFIGTISPTLRQWALESIAMQRFGQAEEVAAAIAFLASPRASYITGHVLVIDGGWVMP
jgi:3-oxoacyl-[acyl-carrier protein] reductase